MSGCTSPEMTKEVSSLASSTQTVSKSNKHSKKKKKHKHKQKQKRKKKDRNKKAEHYDEEAEEEKNEEYDHDPPSLHAISSSLHEHGIGAGDHKGKLPSMDAMSLGGTLNIVELGNSLDALTTECGTVAYMAPELLEHIKMTKHFTYATENLVLYTKSVDVYSFGLILWELCTEQLLYEDFDDLRDIREYVLNGGRPHIPSYILGTYAGLMKDCWSQSPLHRPDFLEIVRRLHLMLGISRNKSEDNSLFNWNLADAMQASGRH